MTKPLALLLALLITISAPFASARSSRSRERVSGYTTKRGTRVKSYQRSTKDRTRRNNWSTKGNVNPVTGKRGMKRATN